MPARSAVIVLFALLLGVAATPAPADELDRDALAAQVANAYGFERWGEVEELRYTFNVKMSGREIARVWTWRPKENVVTRRVEGEPPVTYDRDDLSADTPDEVIAADRQFINDSYWLLYPFQLVWSNPAITDAGSAALPIGEGEARKLITQFPDVGGYTPGDAYDLFLDERHMILQWTFRKGGGDTGPSMTWDANLPLGPITVSTDHRNADGTFRLWFTGLSLTSTTGETFEAE